MFVKIKTLIVFSKYNSRSTLSAISILTDSRPKLKVVKFEKNEIFSGVMLVGKYAPPKKIDISKNNTGIGPTL